MPVKAKALVEFFRNQPGIQNAFGRSQLDQGPLHDPIGEMVRLSYYPACSGAGHCPQTVPPGLRAAGRGQKRNLPHHPRLTASLRHSLPLLVFGAGVQPGTPPGASDAPGSGGDMARALGIPPPEGAEYPVPEGLFEYGHVTTPAGLPGT